MTRILIADEDQTLQQALVHDFHGEGYDVLTAGDGLQALETMRRECPDLAILEMALPRLDGLAVCRMARGDTRLARMAVMMLTSRGTQIDKIAALDSGADDYILKPYEPGEMLARVRAVLRRIQPHTPLPEMLTSTDMRIDLISRKAYRGTQQLRLSAKEFDLLLELMRNRGAVLSREMILARVWGRDLGGARTIDVHVRWLRQKIEDDPSNPRHIVSVRGIGYRFEG